MTALTVLLGLLMAATALVLVTGLVGFMGGGRFNARWGNRLMQARVALQFLAIVVLGLLMMLKS